MQVLKSYKRFSKVKPLSTKQLQEQTAFEQDVIAVMEGREDAVLMPHMYENPLFEGDLVNGANLWTDVYNKAHGYYLGKGEREAIANNSDNIAKLLGEGVTFVDLGPGSATSVRAKTFPLLESIRNVERYIPIDVSKAYVDSSIEAVSHEFPHIKLKGIQSDFYVCSSLAGHYKNSVAFFSGSTIGNIPEVTSKISYKNIVDKLVRLKNLVGEGGTLIITQDTNQDEASLCAAYHNEYTKKFTLNVLHRINRDLNTNGFDASAFTFDTQWNPQNHFYGRYAVPTKDQTFSINARILTVKAGQKLDIVRSYKYSADAFIKLGQQAGFNSIDCFMDSSERTAVHVWGVSK